MLSSTGTHVPTYYRSSYRTCSPPLPPQRASTSTTSIETETKTIRKDLQTLKLTPTLLQPLDKDSSSDDNLLPPVLRAAPKRLRNWFKDLSKLDPGQIYKTEVTDEDKSWVEGHHDEIMEALPARCVIMSISFIWSIDCGFSESKFIMEI